MHSSDSRSSLLPIASRMPSATDVSFGYSASCRTVSSRKNGFPSVRSITCRLVPDVTAELSVLAYCGVLRRQIDSSHPSSVDLAALNVNSPIFRRPRGVGAVSRLLFNIVPDLDSVATNVPNLHAHKSATNQWAHPGNRFAPRTTPECGRRTVPVARRLHGRSPWPSDRCASCAGNSVRPAYTPQPRCLRTRLCRKIRRQAVPWDM